MAGRGRAPKSTRRNAADTPIRGDWQSTIGIGWQHGDIPDAPDGLLEPSRVAWVTWMRSWIASHWTPDNLPDLRTCIRLYDQVERGEFTRSTELRMWEDNLGITPKGQQDRRWVAPKADEAPAAVTEPGTTYGHLRAV